MIFDFFKKREYSNVVQFPEKAPYPYIEPPEKIVRELHYYLFHFLDKYSFWCYTN